LRIVIGPGQRGFLGANAPGGAQLATSRDGARRFVARRLRRLQLLARLHAPSLHEVLA
jgi:hypothetical protein